MKRYYVEVNKLDPAHPKIVLVFTSKRAGAAHAIATLLATEIGDAMVMVTRGHPERRGELVAIYKKKRELKLTKSAQWRKRDA